MNTPVKHIKNRWRSNTYLKSRRNKWEIDPGRPPSIGWRKEAEEAEEDTERWFANRSCLLAFLLLVARWGKAAGILFSLRDSLTPDEGQEFSLEPAEGLCRNLRMFGHRIWEEVILSEHTTNRKWAINEENPHVGDPLRDRTAVHQEPARANS